MSIDSLYRAHRTAPTHETETALYDSVRRLAAQIVARSIRHDREDVTADIVAQVWMSLDNRLDDSVPFSAWVRSIAKRRVNDYIRRTTRRPKLVSAEDDALDNRHQPAQDVARFITMDVESLPGLKDAQRDLLQRFVDNPDYDALANELGMSQATLRNKLNRIAKKVAKTAPVESWATT